MFSDKELQQYNRHLILPEIGMEGQLKLKNAKVLVIGAGGLGCPALQYLAAAGVGTICIMDGDVVDISNLHRQILYNYDDIGKPKAEIAAKKLSKLNPYSHISYLTSHISTTNALSIIADFDLVIDGSDNFPTRYLLNDSCVILNKPLVFGSIFKFEGQISVFNYKQGPTYRCLYPEPPNAGDMPNCSEIGVMGVLPGIVGCMQANEAIKIITNIGEPLSGKLLCFNALDMQFNIFEFELNPENRKTTALIEMEEFCVTDIRHISNLELKQMFKNGEDIQLIDVREEKEYDAGHIGGELMPLSEFESHIPKISRTKKVIVHCHSGIRSLTAIEILLDAGYTNVWNLKNGILGF